MSDTNIPNDVVGYYLNLGDSLQAAWPSDIVQLPSVDILKDLWYEPLQFRGVPTEEIRTSLILDKEFALGFPGLDGISLVFAGQGNASAFSLGLETSPNHIFRIYNIPLAIRFRNDLLRPAKRIIGTNGKPDTIEALPKNQPLDITLAEANVLIDLEGGFSLQTDVALNLPLCLIGDTGIAIEAQHIQIFGTHDTPPPGKPAGWRGVYMPSASLYLPGELAGVVGNLTVTNAYFGHGGFSGAVTDTWPTPLSTEWLGMTLSLKSVTLTFVQNTLTAASIKGAIKLPFFDQMIDVEIAPSLNGELLIKLDAQNGLIALSKPDILTLTVESLGFKVANGLCTFLLSGSIQPLVGGLSWPEFKVKELAIDTDGNVHLDGGWLNLPDQYSLDFHGFQMEITKLAMGKTVDGGRWIGLSGGIKLADGLPVGVSVDGLRIAWYDSGASPTLSFDGIGVEFAVPNALSFKGAVAYKQISATEHRFDGAIKLNLIALNLVIDGQLVIGRQNGTNYFAIYLGVELPAGIPLGPTGLGLYGLAGLFAVNMQPNKTAQETWYGWYKRGTVGVTALATKWQPQPSAFAFGAGVTLGTVADNGYAFSGRVLLALIFPGPVLIIEGKANLLQERAKLNGNADPLFRALAVLDANEGTFLFNLDARYKYGANGELLDLAGGAEGYFGNDDWHLYLGQQETREKRIRAQVFHLFDASTYFMLSAKAVKTGVWVGIEKHWHFGPFGLTLEAWLEANAALSFQPAHFHGDLWAHGKVELSICGLGFGLTIDGRLAADVFEPYHLLAELAVAISLPWPASITVSATFGHSASPDNVTCGHSMTLQ